MYFYIYKYCHCRVRKGPWILVLPRAPKISGPALARSCPPRPNECVCCGSVSDPLRTLNFWRACLLVKDDGWQVDWWPFNVRTCKYMLPFVLNSCEIDRSLREMAYLLDDHSTSYKLMLVVARERSAYVAAICFPVHAFIGDTTTFAVK
jgi:hypothetical protein